MSNKIKIQPYLQLMRFHQPVGVWLLFWPCAWGVTMALPEAGHTISSLPLLLALFFLGSVTMRSAGCIINDLWDRDIDAKVERTRNRPLASGLIKPRQAFILLMLLFALSCWIVLQLPILVFWLALASLPLIILYPLMKRITWWPQAFLGLTFNWGALMGWAAVTGEITPQSAWLYAACICWTLGYDTLYAHQDIADDTKIGVKSTARLFGNATRQWLALFYALMLFFMHLAGLPLRALPLLAAPLLCQLIFLAIHNPVRCGQQFRFHALYGALVWLDIALISL